MAVSHPHIDRCLHARPVDYPVRAAMRVAAHPRSDRFGGTAVSPRRTGGCPRRRKVRRAVLPVHDVHLHHRGNHPRDDAAKMVPALCIARPRVDQGFHREGKGFTLHCSGAHGGYENAGPARTRHAQRLHRATALLRRHNSGFRPSLFLAVRRRARATHHFQEFHRYQGGIHRCDHHHPVHRRAVRS